jgi:hypothetical protein
LLTWKVELSIKKSLEENSEIYLSSTRQSLTKLAVAQEIIGPRVILSMDPSIKMTLKKKSANQPRNVTVSRDFFSFILLEVELDQDSVLIF